MATVDVTIGAETWTIDGGSPELNKVRGGAALSKEQKKERIKICNELLDKQRDKPEFLESIVTSDEISLKYCSVGKPTGHSVDKNCLLFTIFWDSEGIIHIDNYDRPMDAMHYTELLKGEVKKKLIQKRNKKEKEVRLYHDGATPHTAQITKDAIKHLGWEKLPHPPHSPDLAPSDYYLFPDLVKSIKEKYFQSKESLCEEVENYFSKKKTDYFKKGIEMFPDRWRACIENGGDRLPAI